jgi:hypothetical protein
MSADLERGYLFLDLLPSDCLLGGYYAFLPPLIILAKWSELYTEQGPREADSDRVFEFY